MFSQSKCLCEILK